jgi:hypothetical protein
MGVGRADWRGEMQILSDPQRKAIFTEAFD